VEQRAALDHAVCDGAALGQIVFLAPAKLFRVLARSTEICRVFPFGFQFGTPTHVASLMA